MSFSSLAFGSGNSKPLHSGDRGRVLRSNGSEKIYQRAQARECQLPLSVLSLGGAGVGHFSLITHLPGTGSGEVPG